MIIKTYPIAEKLIKKGLNLSIALLDVLTKEADILLHRADPQSLSNIAVKKKDTVSQLNHVSKQLSQVLSTENYKLTSEGISDYFKKAQFESIDTKISSQQWKELLSISIRCRQLNEQNGASINLLMQHSQRSLHIIKGKSQQATTYGSDGSTQRELFSHSLVSV